MPESMPACSGGGRADCAAAVRLPIAAIVLDVVIYVRRWDGMQWSGVLLMGTALLWAGRTDAVRTLATHGVQGS